jgi:sulfite reductase (NADPH) hemoprotein beta-component
MVGGGADGETATFGRIAAKIPARRVPEAVARIVDLYRSQGNPDERLADFLRRTDISRVKHALADLENLTEADAQPDDFIDPGEDHAFQPEVLDGECSA